MGDCKGARDDSRHSLSTLRASNVLSKQNKKKSDHSTGLRV